ncbi:MAG: MOSC domain-containing protein [Bacteroidota bacterium]
MKVISTNLAQPVSFEWNGETHTTGIFKYPVNQALTLQEEIVENDTIADRRVHGGIFKACYLFSSDNYPFWKEKYPHLDWKWGMFGENLTVEGLNESILRIGSIYRLGTALVQITQPREPCYKLGYRFGNQGILSEFIEHAAPGTYVRVLESGQVAKGDEVELVEESKSPLTVKQFYKLLFSRQKDTELLQLAVDNEALPLRKREKLRKFL